MDFHVTESRQFVIECDGKVHHLTHEIQNTEDGFLHRLVLSPDLPIPAPECWGDDLTTVGPAAFYTGFAEVGQFRACITEYFNDLPEVFMINPGKLVGREHV